MDSSSNDSFAWSRVSDDSEDSDLDPMGSPETPLLNAHDDEIPPSKNTKKRKLKFEPPDSESSFDSPKKKKIKVEKTEEYASKKKKKKKEKHDDSEILEYSDENVLEDYDYLTMKVKQEQDDLERATVFKTKKNKKKYSETDENNSFNENNTSEKKNKHGTLKTDSDNDKPVSSPKKQRNKKKHEITADESDNFIIEEKFSAEETEVQKIPAYSTSHDNDKPASSPKKQRSKKKHEITADESDDNFIVEDKFSAEETEVQKIHAYSTSHDNDKPASSPKKQRSKKKHENTADESDNFIVEDKFSAGETEVQKIPANSTSHNNDKPASSPKKQRSKKKHEITADESDNSIIKDKFSAEEADFQKIPAKYMSHDTEISDRRVTGDEVEGTENIDTFENSIVLKEKKVKKISNSSDDLSSANTNNKQNVTPRILDRIRFEDESDLDTDKTKKISNKQNNTNKKSAHLNKFLKGKTYLKPVLEKMQKCQEITDNDELWILKCPQELDVTDFNNRDLILESKSKVKLNSGTYIGSLDEDIDRITVMTADNEEFIIKNVPVNGVVTLRKRLPKPHVVEDNVMINQTDFIPLPDTKCRHPLFGSNYKSSLKLPSPVAQRLNDGHISTSVTVINDTKKKKKKVKVLNGDLNAEIDVKPKIEVNGVIKKAKKRKHDKDNEKSIKKAKRIKQEPDSSDVWESEKAIEENLFNF